VRTAQAVLIILMILAPSFVVSGGFYLVHMLVQRIGLPLRQCHPVGLADPADRGAVAALSNVPSQLAMSVSPLVTGSCPVVLAGGWVIARSGPALPVW
jgi:hypothetical protein